MRSALSIRRDPAWYLGKMSEELGEVTAAYLKLQGQGRGEATQAGSGR